MFNDMAKLVIGIDFSKESFDISFFEVEKREEVRHFTFSNEPSGFRECLRTIRLHTRLPRAEWLFCGENTGLYSYHLSEFLTRKGLFMWLEDPGQIASLSGLRHEKTDAADSLSIAMYAFRFMDKARRYLPADKALLALKFLSASRRRLVEARKMLATAATEIRSVIGHNLSTRQVYESHMKCVKQVEKRIGETEREMQRIIRENETLRENYLLLTSVKCVGPCTAVEAIVSTENFTTCDSAAQLAAYAGVVPRKHESGTSIRRRPHVRKRCNQRLRALLTECAQSAINFSPEMKAYYQRKREQGKPHNLIVNNIRHKLLMRMFAVIRRRENFICDPINYEIAKMRANSETFNDYSN